MTTTTTTAASASATTASASAWKVLRFPATLLEYCSMKCNIITVPSEEGDFQIYVPSKVSRHLRGNTATLAYVEDMQFYKKTEQRNSNIRIHISEVIKAFTKYQSEGEEIREFPRNLTYGLDAKKCATCADLVAWVDANFAGDKPLRVYEQWDGKYMRYQMKRENGEWVVLDRNDKKLSPTSRVSLKACVLDTHEDSWLNPPKPEKITVSKGLEDLFEAALREKSVSHALVKILRKDVEDGEITEEEALMELLDARAARKE